MIKYKIKDRNSRIFQRGNFKRQTQLEHTTTGSGKQILNLICLRFPAFHRDQSFSSPHSFLSVVLTCSCGPFGMVNGPPHDVQICLILILYIPSLSEIGIHTFSSTNQLYCKHEGNTVVRSNIHKKHVLRMTSHTNHFASSVLYIVLIRAIFISSQEL